MARMPRLYVEGCAQHIIQRGNNRAVCFYCDADYAFYLQKLKEASEKYLVKEITRTPTLRSGRVESPTANRQT